MKDHAGNLAAFKRILPKVLESTLSCYPNVRTIRLCAMAVLQITDYIIPCFCHLTGSMNANDKVLILEILKMKLRWPTLISVAQRSADCRHSTL